MKFSKLGQVALASAASLGLGLGITACGVSNTVDFLYVTSSKNATGEISAYAVDGQSGSLSRIQGSPFPSMGRNPVAEAASPNGKNLYVVHHDDNTIVWFAIGTDGKLYPQKTYNTPGSNPDAITINTAGTLLFVVDAFQPGFSSSNPGPGALVVYQIAASGALTLVNNGATPYTPVCNNPVAVNVIHNGSAVYVANDPAGQLPSLGDVTSSSNGGVIVYPAVGNCTGNTGQISSFTVGSGGALTPAAGSPFNAGVAPTSIASDPTDRFVYVTDSKSNQMIGYNIQPAGVLVPMLNSVFRTEVLPTSVLVDPRGAFIYVANYNSADVSAYAINPTTGVPSGVAGGPYQAGSGASFVLMEPAEGRFVYTANFLDNSISGLFLINPGTGALTNVQNTPQPTAAQPTALAAVRHGNFSTQVVPQF